MNEIITIGFIISLFCNWLLWRKMKSVCDTDYGRKKQIIDEKFHLKKALERSDKKLADIEKKIEDVRNEEMPDTIDDVAAMFRD